MVRLPEPTGSVCPLSPAAKTRYSIFMMNETTMTNFSQINFNADQYPSIWERQYILANGNVAVVTHNGDPDNYAYAVTIHSAVPCSTNLDWWDTVVSDLGATDDLAEVEALINAELR